MWRASERKDYAAMRATVQETGILRPERNENVAKLGRAREIASRSQSGMNRERGNWKRSRECCTELPKAVIESIIETHGEEEGSVRI